MIYCYTIYSITNIFTCIFIAVMCYKYSFLLQTLCIGGFKEGSQLLVYTHLVHLICNSISLEPKILANFQECDEVLNNILKIFVSADTSALLDVSCVKYNDCQEVNEYSIIFQVSYTQSMVALVLMIYLCASSPIVSQHLKQSYCYVNIGSLIQFPFMEIKLLSKALIARLIPADVVRDDKAILILLEDYEVDHLLSMLTSTQPNDTIPSVSIIMDLSRSPHNMWALASKDGASKLADAFDSISEADQAKAAQLICSMVDLNYEGIEDISAITNNGTVKKEHFHEEGIKFCLCFSISCITTCKC